MSQGRHRAVAAGGARRWWVLLLVVSMVAVGGVAVAQTTDPTPLVFSGCLTPGGQLVNVSAGETAEDPAAWCNKDDWYVTWNREGPVGPQGDPGPQGDQGPQGEPGPAGADGADGATGPEGPEGPQGPAGADGTDGAPGPQGPAGADGRDGADGAPGVDGKNGDDGINCWDLNGDGVPQPDEDINEDGKYDALDCQGPEGPEGPEGPGGPQGSEGPEGPPGIVGFYYETDSQLVPPLEVYSVTLVCRNGLPDRAISGSYVTPLPFNSPTTDLHVTASYNPPGFEEAWLFEAFNESLTETIPIETWVLCADLTP